MHVSEQTSAVQPIQPTASKRSRYAVAFTYGPILVLLAVAVGLRLWAGIPFGGLMQDRVVLLGGGDEFYAGAYSTLGLLLWAATAAICLFTAALLPPSRREARVLFAMSAVLTLLLLADDMLLLHEIVFPRYLLIAEEMVLLTLVVLTAAFLFAFRRQILAQGRALMASSLTFFAASVGFDAIPEYPGHFFFEDGAKMLGIAGWCGYWVQRCAAEVRAGFAPVLRLAISVRGADGDAAAATTTTVVSEG